MSLWQRWKRTSLPNKLMVISSCIMALATVCLVIAGILQYLAAREQLKAVREQANVMRMQLEAMNSSSAQTQEVIDATRRMADASQSMAEQNGKLVAQGGKQADIMSKQADTMGRQFDAMNEQARSMGKALGETKLTREIENRPYVVVKQVTLTGIIGAEIQFENTGRTPALNVTADISYGYLDLDKNEFLAEVPWYMSYGIAEKEYQSQPVIAAGTTYNRRVEFTFSNEEELKLKSTGEDIYRHVSGKITYRDIFGQTHTTTFCLYLYGERFVYCPIGNDVN